VDESFDRSSRRGGLTVVAGALIAVLLLGQAAVTLHLGTHAREVQGCDLCAVSHASGALATTVALPGPPAVQEQTVASLPPSAPASPGVECASARAPPLSDLKA